LAEARDEYLSAVTALKAALEQEPNNSRTKRELMLAWSHVGDVEGSPTSSSMGDRARALVAYAEMSKIAEELLAADGDDQRALGDLGIARMRVAAVTDGPARLKRFREALTTIGKAAEKNPKNLTMRMNLAYTQWQFGIALKEERRTAEAMASWREAAGNARAILSSQQSSVVRLLMETLGRMGVTMREAGQDTAAIEAEIRETAEREKAGTISGDTNRAKAALIGMEIAMAGKPLPKAEGERQAAGVKAAWDKVRGKPGWQPTFEKDYLRFVELAKRAGVRIE
jgi:tetratricopeptide (TPR) repeat protein